MTATKPATPLPWITDHSTVIYSTERGPHRGAVAEYGYQQDAAYIVTACNAYPRLLAEREELVQALREACSQLAAVSGLVNSYPRPSLDPNGRTLLDAVEMPKAAYHKHRALLAKLEAA